MRTLLFDLDDTLYPPRLEVVARLDRRINAYLTERIGIALAEVDRVRRHYRDRYGTTLNGLLVHHDVDPDHYLDYVHDVDLSDVLAPDPSLAQMLHRLRGRKVVFTNAARRHADQVLHLLGLADVFERVFALESLDYVAKPDPRAYRCVLDAVTDGRDDCWLVDDRPDNLKTGRDLGLRTVWVRNGSAPSDFRADHVVHRVHDVASLFPERA